jgi:gamma-glutamylcyclotransferase (GGCT)/AIG2-like uncharacterized protein YtfP
VVDKPGEATTLFVYGSLLDPARRQEIIGHRVETTPAILHDYQVGRSRYFYITKHPGISTSGLLLLNLTSTDLQRLDRYEEIPRLYTREKVAVLSLSGDRLECWIYLPTALTLAGNK